MEPSPVRMVDLAARHRADAARIEAGVLEVLRSGRYVGGPHVARAEALAARWFGRRSAVGVGSGTDALMLALQAVGVRAGTEVIVPALSFFATAGAVRSIGAVPVVVDVGEDGCLDPDAARAALTPRTRAVVPVHLFGTLAPRPAVDVPVVDDAAQGIGGDPPRSFGVLSAVSTYPTKTWGAAGDGGFVLGDDPELLGRVRRLANHGLDDVPYQHAAIDDLVGRNSRLDAIQAVVLVVGADDLERRVGRRRALAACYDAALPPGVRPVARDPGSPVHHYVVRVADRDAVRAGLLARGIETGLYYPRPLHREPALGVGGRAPMAERLCAEAMALPVHADLTDAEVARVIGALHEVVG